MTIEHELFIGLVGAIGTDLEVLQATLEKSFSAANYKSSLIHISELLHEIDRWETLPEDPLDERIVAHMNAGDAFRELYKGGEALALAGVAAVVEERNRLMFEEESRGVVYVMRSLKHPDEVKKLRYIYGDSFILVAAYSPFDTRSSSLAARIGLSKNDHLSDFLPEAHNLMRRDQQDLNKEFGQNVQKTFPLADIFVNVTDTEALNDAVDRFVQILFSYPFHTPTRDEYGMFHAQAAALRTASLSRQVGAVIATNEGDIIATGTNEVPKAGGGTYWAGDKPDKRDFKWGFDTSNQIRINILADLLKRLSDAGWLMPDFSKQSLSCLIDAAFSRPTEDKKALIENAQLMNLIEYGRTVHAEMTALTDAARRGVAVKGHTLYTTTFPCHDCARHIVAAGIARVVYIEPYAKSLANELHGDSIVVDKPGFALDKVSFEPFVGMSPRRYMDLFAMVERKDEKSGKIVAWNPVSADLRLDNDPNVYVKKEAEELAKFRKKLEALGLKPVGAS